MGYDCEVGGLGSAPFFFLFLSLLRNVFGSRMVREAPFSSCTYLRFIHRYILS